MCQSVEDDTQCDVACVMGLERPYDPDSDQIILHPACVAIFGQSGHIGLLKPWSCELAI